MWNIIDSDNYAASGIETMYFPGGEPHIKIKHLLGERVLLFLKVRNIHDAMMAALVCDAITRFKDVQQTRIFMPYFPGARQDRPVLGTAHTLRLMWEFFKAATDGELPFVFDPHSSHLSDRLNTKQRIMMPVDLPLEQKADVVGVIAPDAGATARAKSFRDKFYPLAELVQCAKHRDPHTGQLSGYVMSGLPRPGRYIIVDDICDGGGTFNLLAHEFSRDPIASECKLELFVSHGIFSRGIPAINPLIEHITTTDSWCVQSDARLTILPLRTLFPIITGEVNA